jgi:hypothetical protein
MSNSATASSPRWLAQRGSRLRRYLIAALPLSTGAGLLLHLYLGGRLLLMLGIAGLPLSLAAWLAWRGCSPGVQALLRRRAGVGALAGLCATAAYDAVRWLMLRLFDFGFQPFDIFPIFGRLLLGARAAAAPACVVGVLFHVCNGIGFAVAYALLFARRAWWAGIAWALTLEAIMLLVYPSWLHIRALGEFRAVSLVGHFTYGGVLGALTRRWLGSEQAGPP